jgi:predicted nucleotidyltransferase
MERHDRDPLARAADSRGAARAPRRDPPVAARHGVFNIRIFGSVARGDASAESDVDFLFDIEEGRSLLDLGGFYTDLEDLLGRTVDVGRSSSRVCATASSLSWYRCE